MPFQSEKQRRFLHANHPEIAKRWEKEYSHGGILDINESEEIISDDGNDIELTDYNAAFDDPNDLSTGVKSLFQAKNGGRIGFRRGTSGAPGGGDPGMTSGGDKGTTGGNGKDYGPYSKGPPTQTKSKGDTYKDPILDMVDKKKIPGTEEYMEEEKKDYVFMPEKKLVDNKFAKTRKAQYVTLKEKEYWDRLDKVAEDIRDSWSYKTEKKIGSTLIDMAIGAVGIPGLGWVLGLLGLKPKAIPKRNLAGDILEDEVTGADLGFFDPDEYPELWGKGPDEDDKGGPELPPQLGGPSTQEMATEYYGMSALDKIRAGQAKYAAYIDKIEREKLAREDNPIVGGTERNIIAIGNSGGLANLFRVKNQ